MIGAWRDMTVIPLREVRRALKSPPPVMPPEAAEGFRTRIKAVELEAERLQQEAMYDLAQSGRFGQARRRPAAGREDQRGRLSGAARRLPAGALEAVLSAFAKFESQPLMAHDLVRKTSGMRQLPDGSGARDTADKNREP